MAATMLIAGGAASLLFWVTAAALGSFAGAEVIRDPLWIPSQTLHTVGALLVLAGLPAVGDMLVRAKHRWGNGGVVLALIGTALFAADGLIAVSVLPTLASTHADLVAATGAMNRGLMLATYVLVSVVNMLGWIVLSVALLRVGPRFKVPGVLLLVGAILFNLPPGPVPLLVLAAGGVAWSLGIAWIGVLIRPTRASGVRP